MLWKNRRDEDSPASVPLPGLRAVVLRECNGMGRYALGRGLKVPPSIVALLEHAENPASTGIAIEELVLAHSTLSALISPAKPYSVIPAMEDQALHPRLSLLGPLPLVRALLYIEVAALIVMLFSSLWKDVNTQNIQMGLFKNSGWALLKCEIFLVSVSLVGSAFGALFKMYHFIAKDTYDPKHSSVYWIQLVLGVISGVVLSQVLYNAPPPGTKLADSLLLQQPVLALAGGFSASLVHRILSRFLRAIESVFGADLSEPEVSVKTKRVAVPDPTAPVIHESAVSVSQPMESPA